jgi:1,4-alpha-glucan branching enzyme
VELLAGGQVVAELAPGVADGIFEAQVANPPRHYVLRIAWPDGKAQETEDPYAFGPVLGELDVHLLAEGRHRELWRALGAHVTTIDGIAGVRFAVWAPNATRVSVVGDFNVWDGRRHPMRLRGEAGVWELFIPRLTEGARYKYELLDAAGRALPLKADPVAQQAEPAPATASVVPDPRPPVWSARALPARTDGPMSIYEVHAGSWARGDGDRILQWDEIGDRLIPYVQDMGFTHIELLPVMVHPFGGSWGYQPLGQFAPHANLGTPDAFARFVDRAHAAGIGVILDWVPAHFPTDAHGLVWFDGTALYEHSDPKEGFHRDWNTAIYNFGRHEVRGFLIASALYWLQHYRVDGLRVDAVASMLYRDYSRNPGEWVPNRYGGRENLEAVDFLRELSRAVAERCPGAMLIAEESTAWPGVTRTADEGGLGFTHKWNMGWMHDTLDYMHHDPVHRGWHHDAMTFGLIYAFTERFVLPLSHDEVVHGKGSLVGKMPGDDWQRFANLRAYLSFMWGHPGKKLLFMGGEFAQRREWNHDISLDWHLLDHASHRGMQRLVADLNRLHVALPALHRHDFDPEGFTWLVSDDRTQSVFAFLRRGGGADRPVLVVVNFTPMPRHDYRIGVPIAGAWSEILNSDAAVYGGSGVGNGGTVLAEAAPLHGQPASLRLTLPPLGALMLTPSLA